MEIPRSAEKRRAVAGILAAVILFAMIFTAGLSFFLYQQVLNHSYDMASQYNRNVLSSRNSQQLSLASHPVQGKTSAGTMLSAIATNAGGNSSTIVQFFIRDQVGKLVCLSGSAVAPVPSCSTALVSSTNVNVLPSTFSMSVGSSVNITTSYASNNAALTGCSTAATCSVNLVTNLGSVFTGSFPLPNPSGVTITTSLSATYIGPGGSVFDTALLSGETSNAGGTVTYNWYGDGACGAIVSGKTAVVPTVTVTNGVVPNSAPVTFNTAGSYSFQAVYSGDVNNAGATSPCEPFTVSSQCVPSAVTFCFATVASGLGSIAMDFNSYHWYLASGCGSVGTGSTCTINPWPAGGGVKNSPNSGYTISKAAVGGSLLVFSMNITNADPMKRTITLDLYCSMQFFDPSSGQQPSGSVFDIVSFNYVTHQTQGVYAPITLNYGQSTTIWFGRVISGGQLSGISAPPVLASVFVFFHGNIGAGTNNFGQNLPFATTLWNP